MPRYPATPQKGERVFACGHYDSPDVSAMDFVHDDYILTSTAVPRPGRN